MSARHESTNVDVRPRRVLVTLSAVKRNRYLVI